MKIISGGQTGVDRAALDAALDLGLDIGGWCPQRGRCEDMIAIHYPPYSLAVTPSSSYAQRTEWNVRDSDATLLLTLQPGLRGGTLKTWRYTVVHGRPVTVYVLGDPKAPPATLQNWVRKHNIYCLNVAGPRESKEPGIYTQAKQFLLEALPPCCP